MERLWNFGITSDENCKFFIFWKNRLKRTSYFKMSEKTHFWPNVRSFEVLVLKNAVISISQLNNVERNGNFRPKNFCRAYVKVFILRKKPHESTQMVPEYPQKIFYCLLVLCMDFQKSSWGGGNFPPPRTWNAKIVRFFLAWPKIFFLRKLKLIEKWI